jgi:hypothetical protein
VHHTTLYQLRSGPSFLPPVARSWYKDYNPLRSGIICYETLAGFVTERGLSVNA